MEFKGRAVGTSCYSDQQNWGNGILKSFEAQLINSLLNIQWVVSLVSPAFHFTPTPYHLTFSTHIIELGDWVYWFVHLSTFIYLYPIYQSFKVFSVSRHLALWRTDALKNETAARFEISRRIWKLKYTTSNWNPTHKHLPFSSLQEAHSEPPPWTWVWLHSSLALLPAILHTCAAGLLPTQHPVCFLMYTPHAAEWGVRWSLTWLTPSSISTFFEGWEFLNSVHIVHASARAAWTSHTT